MSFEDRSLRTGPTLGNGSKKNFPYDFLLYSAEEIEVVKLNNTTLTETLYSYDDGDFTVDGIGEDNGGEITLAAGVTAPTSGESILCRPKTKLRQQLVLTEGGKVPMVSLMKALDMMGFRICELWEVVSRTLVGGASTIFTGINGAIDGRALKFKDNGDGTWSIEPSVSDPDAAGSAVIAAEAARDAALGYASNAGDEASASEASRIAAEAAQAATEAAAASLDMPSPTGKALQFLRANADGTAPEYSGVTLDTDGTFSANSDTRIPSQKAAKTYADGLFSRLETRTSDPSSPVAGQMWLRTDL